MSQSECESLADNDAFSQLRMNEHLVPSQPPSVVSEFIHLEFPSNHIVRLHDSNPLRDVIRVSLRVDASPGCGGIPWPAGNVLSRYVARHAQAVVADKHVIELGSGTGLVGLVAASSGAKRVWMTDQAPLLDTMRANVGLNSLADTVHVLEYNWGFPKPDALPPHADLILAADCVYFEADKRFFALLKKHFDWKQVEDDPDYPIYSREAISLLRLTRKR